MTRCRHRYIEYRLEKEAGFNGHRKIRYCIECGVLFDDYQHADGKCWSYRFVPRKGFDNTSRKIKPWRM